MRSAMLASQMLVWCRRGGVSRARLGSIQAWRVEAAESECCRQERLQATAKDVATRCMHEEVWVWLRACRYIRLVRRGRVSCSCHA